MIRKAWCVLPLALLAAACHKSPAESKPSAMPAGYDRIDAAFGVRMTGMTTNAGVHVVPTVEFRTNGDYVMYPFSTDCSGSFSRGQGVVFAPDGTVREQLPELMGASIAANPQYQPVANKVCAQARAALAAVVDGPTVRKTRYGVLRIEGNSPRTLTFEGRPLAEDSAFDFIKVVPIGTRDLVLVRQRTDGSDCAEGRYLLVEVASPTSASAGDSFGTCMKGEPKISGANGALTISMPSRLDGMDAVYKWHDGVLSSNDGDIQDAIGADPEEFRSEGNGDETDDDAAQSAVDAATQAADDAANAVDAAARPVIASRGPRDKWTAACASHSRRVTTPAGSQVGLDPSEAEAYCGCLWSSAPDMAASVLQAGGDPSALDAPRWRTAQGTCIDQLL